MNRFSQQERRNRIILRAVIGLILALVVGFFFVDSPLRQGALDALNLAQEHDQRQQIFKLILATFAVVIVGGGILLDFSEKLHFLFEIFPKLLGFDVESMAEREKDFPPIPETYVRRPPLEKKLAHDLASGTAPRLVVLADAPETGKTTLVTFVARRFLSRRSRGRVTYVRGDLQSVNRGASEKEEDARMLVVHRILTRVIKAAEIGGDTGDTVQSMSKAVAEHFEREHKPWLIVIDQIDDPNFAYQELLPSLYGANNVILVISQQSRIPEAARHVAGEDRLVSQVDLSMEPLTTDEAVELLGAEVRVRHKQTSRSDITRLRPFLNGASPGLIQRLSDYYASTGVTGDIARFFLQKGDTTSQNNAVASAVVQQFPPDQRQLIGALGLLSGDTVGEQLLGQLAEQLGLHGQADALLNMCLQRRYLESIAGAKTKGTRRFTITKLGRGIAINTLLAMGHNEELIIGAALLDIFRTGIIRNGSLDMREEVHQVLGMITWAHEQSQMPDRDLIGLIRVTRRAFYEAGIWTAGISWLTEAENIAAADELHRTVGDLASARAQLLIGLGHLTSARECIGRARTAYMKSTALAEEDLRHNIFDEEEMRNWMRADEARRRWLEHLGVLERLWGASMATKASEFDDIAASIDAVSKGDGTTDVPEHHLPVMLAIDMARAQMSKGDALLDEGNHTGARVMWRAALRTLNEVAHPGRKITTTQAEWLAQIWRLKGSIHRRRASISRRMSRWWNRRLGNRDFILALGYSRRLASNFEQSLTLYESALLAIQGSPMLTDPLLAVKDHAPRRILSLRWGRLQSARRQLIRASGQFATLHAQATRFHAMVALTQVTLALAAISHDTQTLIDAKDYAMGARTISEDLRAEHPALMIALKDLPIWLVPESSRRLTTSNSNACPCPALNSVTTTNYIIAR